VRLPLSRRRAMSLSGEVVARPETAPAKVVIISSVHRASDVRIFHKEARSLVRAGYNVTLFAEAPCDACLDGVRIRALKEPSSRFARVLTSLKLTRRILKEMADIYHFHDPELIPLGLLLRLLGRKVIYDAHEDLPKDIFAKSYLPRCLRPFLASIIGPMERFAASMMSAVVTATDSIQKRFPGSVVLHNYPILSYIRHGLRDSSPPAQETPFLIYTGLILRRLGALEMLAAIRAVSHRFPARLRLVGPFQDDALRSRTLHSGKPSLVDYRGLVPMPDVYQNYPGALAGLVLYHPHPNHIEAMPNKLFECMAFGVPLIVSDFPLWRRIVHDQGCGLVVDPLNVPQIADAIIHLLEHPEEAKKMGRRGRELVEQKYNWESESRKLLLLYQRLLRKAAKASPFAEEA